MRSDLGLFHLLFVAGARLIVTSASVIKRLSIVANSKRNSSRSPRSGAPPAAAVGEESTSLNRTGDFSSPSETPSLPPTWLIRPLSVFAALHLFLIGLTYFSVVSPSTLQVRALAIFRPYLSAFHFDADGAAFNVATSLPKEKAHLLEQSREVRPDIDSWEMVDVPGIAGSDRQRRWQRFLSGIAELGENEQSAIAAWLVEPLAIVHGDAKFLRIRRMPDLMTTVVDDTAAPPYTAAVLRDADSAVRVVLVPAQRLASPAVNAKAAGDLND